MGNGLEADSVVTGWMVPGTARDGQLCVFFARSSQWSSGRLSERQSVSAECQDQCQTVELHDGQSIVFSANPQARETSTLGGLNGLHGSGVAPKSSISTHSACVLALCQSHGSAGRSRFLRWSECDCRCSVGERKTGESLIIPGLKMGGRSTG